MTLKECNIHDSTDSDGHEQVCSCRNKSVSRCECHSAGVGGHFTSGAVPSGEVSPLDHEVLDDSVEFAALVTKSFLLIQNKHNKINNN